MTEVKTMYETPNYKVVVHADCLGEDGEYGKEGYAVINKDNGVVEHTTMMLPGAIFQCQHFSDTLTGLLKGADTTSNGADIIPLTADVPDDILPS